LANLLNGSDKGFETLGSEYEPFVSYLPKTGAISFIMDYPFSNYARTVEQLYTAQSYLVPLIINPGTEEKIAILYCSSDEIADHRLNQSQYKPLARLGAGKGIALKQS